MQLRILSIVSIRNISLDAGSLDIEISMLLINLIPPSIESTSISYILDRRTLHISLELSSLELLRSRISNSLSAVDCNSRSPTELSESAINSSRTLYGNLLTYRSAMLLLECQDDT